MNKKVHRDRENEGGLSSSSSSSSLTTRWLCVQRKHHLRAIFRCVALLSLIFGYSAFNFTSRKLDVLRTEIDNKSPNHQRNGQNGFASEQRRHLLLSPDTSSTTPASFFPNQDIQPLPQSDIQSHRRDDVPCDEIPRAEPTWYLAFYITGVLYCFLALAIVCDEFFVPALEEMSSDRHMDLSMDVAGATLMAAGGSAPELFTSLIGTFLDSDIGFGTIVGSAVFNVLFVIGMCSLLSKEVLTLTWWPLFRDCTYYVIGLVMLAVFVGVISPEKIYVWEAVILFVMYLGYVILMKYNRHLYKMLTGKELTFGEEEATPAPASPASRRDINGEKKPATGATEENGDSKPEAPEIELEERGPENHVVTFDSNCQGQNREDRRQGLASTPRADSSRSVASAISMTNYTHGRWPGTFRAGILKLLRNPMSWVETAGVGIVSKIAGDADTVFKHVDRNGDGSIDSSEFATLMEELDCHLNPVQLTEVFQAIDEDKDGKIDEREFTKWYIRSEELILSRVRETFNAFDLDKNGKIDRTELKNLLTRLEPSTSSSDVDDAMKACYQEGSRDEISYEEFSDWYIHSILYDRQKKEVEDNMEGACQNLKPPQGGTCWEYITYVVYLPLVAVFSLTIPDTRRPGLGRWCYLSFILSICWIGFFSYFMVGWTELIGNTVGIPSVVMGLTFLAAGTSVPDLLSSVIVARRGEGDMAVSSSIGSNIFDILIGLPLPWIIYTAWPSKPDFVTIESSGVWISIFVLLGMVIAIIVTIHCNGWKLTKTVGFIMFLLYIAFLAQAIIQELPFQSCTP